VINYEPGKILKHEELFELPVDIIIPASIPDVINQKNVDKIIAKLVVEAANIPTTYEMEKKLQKNGVLVIPDIIANAGGLISSYLEYIGGNPQSMFSLIKKKITKNLSSILKEAKKENLLPRDVALRIAHERVKKAMEKN
jgi:glutamate dehydrogenase/leucine dehydrogenase